MAWFTVSEPARSFAAAQRAASLPRARDLPRLRRKAGWGRIAGLALLGAVLALLADLGFERQAALPLPDAPAPDAASRWVEIESPAPLFALDAPEFAKAPALYQARRQMPGGTRQDMLTFGHFDGGAAYLYLSLTRPGAETGPPAPFFVAMARHAAEAGLAVTRSDQPAPLATRFGAFETADVALERAAAQASCLGFRFEGKGLHIAGLACGAGRPPERNALACSLDRLGLVPASADADLGRFFKTAAARHDQACGRAATKSTGPEKKHQIDHAHWPETK
jgi:hypothetical protein